MKISEKQHRRLTRAFAVCSVANEYISVDIYATLCVCVVLVVDYSVV